MINFGGDGLEFSFPGVHKRAVLTVTFERTRRLSYDGEHYPLCTHLGTFPLHRIDHYAYKVPASWLNQGGVILPMYQAEALLVMFYGKYLSDHQTDYPFAVKLTVGIANAVTGRASYVGLHRDPQDYVVSTEQDGFDGYRDDGGRITPFVAKPLRGDDSSTEKQWLNQESGCDGILIEVWPMKEGIFEKRFPLRIPRTIGQTIPPGSIVDTFGMLISPGEWMRGGPPVDPFSIEDWDTHEISRCFVRFLNSATWREVTGENPYTEPPRLDDATDGDLPWAAAHRQEVKALEDTSCEESGCDPLLAETTPDPRSIESRTGLGPNQVREPGPWPPRK